MDYRLETLVDGKVVRSEQFSSLEDMIERSLQSLSFNDLVYLSDEEIEIAEQNSVEQPEQKAAEPFTPAFSQPKRSRVQTFDLHLNLVTDSQNSILAAVAGLIAPVFTPLGFGDWRISTALITGFMAKESVVATLSILFGSTASLQAVLTTLSAAALLAFCLLYTPCVAAVASIKRELGGKWAAVVVAGQCVIAWLAAYLVHIAGSLF